MLKRAPTFFCGHVNSLGSLSLEASWCTTTCRSSTEGRAGVLVNVLSDQLDAAQYKRSYLLQGGWLAPTSFSKIFARVLISVGYTD